VVPARFVIVHAPNPELKFCESIVVADDVAVALKVAELPKHTVCELAGAKVTVGGEITATDAVALMVHVPFDAVRVYTPAVVEVTPVSVGLSSVEV
jgi:hypothetical protein